MGHFKISFGTGQSIQETGRGGAGHLATEQSVLLKAYGPGGVRGDQCQGHKTSVLILS